MDEEQVKMVVDHYLKNKDSSNEVTVRFEREGNVERMSISTNPFANIQTYLFGVLIGLLMLVVYMTFYTAG